MDNKQKFKRLCRYIWQGNPHCLVAVQINPVKGSEKGLRTFMFAAPDNDELRGTVNISEAGMLELVGRLGYSSVRIIRQRGEGGRLAIPNPDQIERDELLDY